MYLEINYVHSEDNLKSHKHFLEHEILLAVLLQPNKIISSTDFSHLPVHLLLIPSPEYT